MIFSFFPDLRSDVYHLRFRRACISLTIQLLSPCLCWLETPVFINRGWNTERNEHYGSPATLPVLTLFFPWIYNLLWITYIELYKLVECWTNVIFSEMLWNIDNWMKYTYLKRLSLTFIYLKYREQVKYSGIFVEEKFESIWFSTATILLVHYSLIWFATVYTFLIVHFGPILLLVGCFVLNI